MSDYCLESFRGPPKYSTIQISRLTFRLKWGLNCTASQPSRWLQGNLSYLSSVAAWTSAPSKSQPQWKSQPQGRFRVGLIIQLDSESHGKLELDRRRPGKPNLNVSFKFQGGSPRHTGSDRVPEFPFFFKPEDRRAGSESVLVTNSDAGDSRGTGNPAGHWQYALIRHEAPSLPDSDSQAWICQVTVEWRLQIGRPARRGPRANLKTWKGRAASQGIILNDRSTCQPALVAQAVTLWSPAVMDSDHAASDHCSCLPPSESRWRWPWLQQWLAARTCQWPKSGQLTGRPGLAGPSYSGIEARLTLASLSPRLRWQLTHVTVTWTMTTALRRCSDSEAAADSELHAGCAFKFSFQVPVSFQVCPSHAGPPAPGQEHVEAPTRRHSSSAWPRAGPP